MNMKKCFDTIIFHFYSGNFNLRGENPIGSEETAPENMC